ncbi:MAG: DUF748 domain-containing protein [Planctomycetes bacterium]|nr:DUF748 domain-containing protein [Planctomycetota bacterium]MBI3848189.1 DUF748 domain-containing protein [Planctomycetota bacterium]
MLETARTSKPLAKKRRSRWRIAGVAVVVLAGVLVGLRLALPSVLRWYVNRVIDENPLYEGRIGDVGVHLWRGAYSISDVRLNKTTGNVPVPLFAAKRVDLAIQWDALWHGKLVGRMELDEPELNFVDAEEPSKMQTGAGGPWLAMIQALSPFDINRALVHQGSIHFRAFHTREPVDVYLSKIEGSIENLTNVFDETAPLITTVTAKGLAMDQAEFEYEMKLDPFSYRPTFEVAGRLLGLDVTKTNSLARAYGAFDFEAGTFDLVVELNAKEGQLDGYVKPLFRDITVLSLRNDIPKDNVLELFWEAVVEISSQLFRNQPHDVLATVIPLTGDLNGPQTDILTVVGNILRNAFIRAYLPRLEGTAEDINGLHFGKGSVTEPISVGSEVDK